MGSLLLTAGCGNSRRINSAESYYDQGIVAGQAGWLDEAFADFGQAINGKQDFAEAYCGRGAIYMAQANYDKAMADLNRTVVLYNRTL